MRARAQGQAADSVGEFHRRLAVLRRTGGFAPTPIAASPLPILPPTVSPNRLASRVAQRRRRDVFRALLASAGATAVLGFLPALRVLWAFNIVADVLFVAYTAMLIRRRNLMSERVEKVRYLPASPPVPELALRRSASS
jgi:hypothetical protein